MDKKALQKALGQVKKGATDALVERNVGGALTGPVVINTDDDFDDAVERVERKKSYQYERSEEYLRKYGDHKQ